MCIQVEWLLIHICLKDIWTCQGVVTSYWGRASVKQLYSILVHWIDGIVILSEAENQAKNECAVIINHMTDWGWLMNPEKIQDLTLTITFGRIVWAGVSCDTLQTTRNKMFLLPIPHTKESYWMIGLFGLWRNHILCLRILLGPIHSNNLEKVILEWKPEQAFLELRGCSPSYPIWTMCCSYGLNWAPPNPYSKT